MKHKAIIFDLDGTLLDTLEDLAQSVNLVLSKHNYPTHDTEKYKYLTGSGIFNLVKNALPSHIVSNDEIKCYVDEVRKQYEINWCIKTKPFDGIPEMLSNLTDNNIKLAILSNKPDYFTRIAVDKFLSDWNFDVVFGERQNVPIKPHPQAALEIASILSLKPEEIIFMGDTNIDMITACNARMYPIGVTWGFRTIDELNKNGAKKILNHPTELRPL